MAEGWPKITWEDLNQRLGGEQLCPVYTVDVHPTDALDTRLTAYFPEGIATTAQMESWRQEMVSKYREVVIVLVTDCPAQQIWRGGWSTP